MGASRSQRDFARHLRSNPTDAEQLLWSRIRKRQLDEGRFRRQAPFGKYVVDFVCHERRLIVELDGGQHTLQRERDAERTVFLESEGYHVIRFWNYEVLEDLETVLEAIWNALQQPESSEESPPP